MRLIICDTLVKHRVRRGRYASDDSYGLAGAFDVPSPCSGELHIVSSGMNDGTGWEHVSASMKNRPPNWAEMCYIKGLFWGDEEVVMQLHPARSQYVNLHPNCLHLWKPTHEAIPLPPRVLVG